MYRLLRPLLFTLDPEAAHHLTFAALEAGSALSLVGQRVPDAPRKVMGLEFRNPVGMAAGMDKNGAHVDSLGALGFGFIEVGTVTPRPQPGNPRPRLFRLPDAEAIINRMGFNNDGVDALVANVKRARWAGVLGINIGKNFDTPVERAADDYLACLRKVYPHAGYVAVNISSPNTPGLRSLQNAGELKALLSALRHEQQALADRHGRHVPLAVKIAPDLESAQVEGIARLLVKAGVDGVIATNTTISREGVEKLPHSGEAGGLSGAPLRSRALRVIRELAAALDGALPIIGVGGIHSGRDARDAVAAGASLVQVYTGLIYRGPGLVPEIAKALAKAPHRAKAA
ncbi:MAG TPA: quinone-dependent dihydroorotate dehydrogenase [Burkholderiales bacterium]